MAFTQALNKKENKGGAPGSPDGGESDGESEATNLTPRTEAKYNKIDEEFQIMMQHRNGNRILQNASSNFSMPVSVPVESSQSQFGGSVSPTPPSRGQPNHGQLLSPGNPTGNGGHSPRPSSGNG